MMNRIICIQTRSQGLSSSRNLSLSLQGGRRERDPGNEDGLHHSDSELTRKIAGGCNEDKLSDAQDSVTLNKDILFGVNEPLLCSTKNYG